MIVMSKGVRRRSAGAAIAASAMCMMATPARAADLPATTIDGTSGTMSASLDTLSAAEATATAPAAWTLADQPPAYGPGDPGTTGQPVVDPASPDPARYRSFGARVGTVKWELGGVLAYMTAYNAVKIKDVGLHSFRFSDEGFFGDGTFSGGMDKVNHAFNAYLLSDIFYHRIARKTGNAPGSAATAAALGFGIQFYSEFFDGIKNSSGWSWNDVGFNALGAGFSYLRNTTPGLKDKLDFRIEIKPNGRFYTFTGGEHYAQQRFLLAVQLAGFPKLHDGPLRFVELHAGYYTKGFTAKERARGDRRDQRPFIGIGLNLNELLFRHAKSRAARAASSVLDYVEVPYTSVRYY